MIATCVLCFLLQISITNSPAKLDEVYSTLEPWKSCANFIGGSGTRFFSIPRGMKVCEMNSAGGEGGHTISHKFTQNAEKR